LGLSKDSTLINTGVIHGFKQASNRPCFSLTIERGMKRIKYFYDITNAVPIDSGFWIA
jgi:hypothetical protein